MKKYLFSNKSNDGSDIHFYFKQISSEEMNESIQIKRRSRQTGQRSSKIEQK